MNAWAPRPRPWWDQWAGPRQWWKFMPENGPFLREEHPRSDVDVHHFRHTLVAEWATHVAARKSPYGKILKFQEIRCRLCGRF